MNYNDFLWREMIKDCSDSELAKKLFDTKFSFYTGFDPTGKSLTVGHLVQIVRIKMMQDNGFKPYVLVGGATGLIGDPREVGERKLLDEKTAQANAKLIKEQLLRFLDDKKCVFVNNYDWIKKLDIITYLRDYGKFFSINTMLAKDVVAKRLKEGISYTEFSYMILQAIDFYHLYKEYGVNVQFGGSDQWGNITCGLDLIKKLDPKAENILGISSPLLLKSDGKKFGKSESGALYLDKELTSPYELYQYFINTEDKDVLLYLKYLTLLSKEEIESIITKHQEAPELRIAQKKLAEEITSFVHGKELCNQAINITASLFSNDITNLSINELDMLYKSIKGASITCDEGIFNILVKTNLAKSNREARDFISSKAILVNNEVISDPKFNFSKDKALFNKYFIIKRGKKNFTIVCLD